MIDIQELLDDRSRLNTETLGGLKEIVDKYPFFQLARLLYVANLYQLHSPDFGRELKKASVFVPDRQALFAITESANYQLPSLPGKSSIETEDDSNRTMTLIDSFLSDSREIEVEDEQPERTQPTVADVTIDYASFLIQQPAHGGSHAAEGDDEQGEAPQLRGGNLIDSFIESTRGKQRVDILEKADGDFSSPEILSQDEEIYTESMVNIYIKQGRYQQALEILRKICTTNPKKSANFASQMQLLEIIVKENK